MGLVALSNQHVDGQVRNALIGRIIVPWMIRCAGGNRKRLLSGKVRTTRTAVGLGPWAEVRTDLNRYGFLDMG